MSIKPKLILCQHLIIPRGQSVYKEKVRFQFPTCRVFHTRSTWRLWGSWFHSAVAEIQLSAHNLQVNHMRANVPVIPQISSAFCLSLEMVPNHFGYLENSSIHNLSLSPINIPGIYIFANILYSGVYLWGKGRRYFHTEYGLRCIKCPNQLWFK